MKQLSILVLILLAGGCASVPGDSGINEIAQTVRDRSGQTLEWKTAVTMQDDPRVRAMLEQPLDADRAVAVAMLNSPRLQMILADLGIARAELIAASTIPNPILELEIRSGASPYRPYEIILAQSLLDLIGLPRRRQLGTAMFEVAKLRVSAEVMRFAAEVRTDYYGLLAASQELEMSRTVMEAARTSTDLAVRQHAGGNITDLDLENEQALYEQAKLDLARAEEQIVLGRERVIRSLGLRDGGNWSIQAEFPPPPEQEMTLQELSTLAHTRRLDVAIARREVEVAERALPLSRRSAIGEIVADVHLSREPSGEKTVGPGIAFPIPIFNRGRAARMRAESELLRSRQSLALVTARADSELRTAEQRLAAAHARIEYYRDVVLPRRARIVELTRLEQNAMLVGVYQLLQARQNEANARREYIGAQFDYWVARNDLDQALNGTGAPELEKLMGERRSGNGDSRRGGH